MFLKRLEINGFKSFAQKTTLDFSSGSSGRRGITAVVGPNGSGKSNIADSIRWIMGEQSMKALRGKSSQDIIFAGSGKKARLGSASATLYFDNSEKRIPLDFSEVSITRKIFRSGESEFSINGSRVRLQDVIDLLAKAGIGKESYSIVTQGMADNVLNSTPLERRSLIEDAAGVKQYQIKKDRAVKKLKSTKENLRRAKELSGEIEPHLRMLKRQAEKASQGEEIAVSLKEKQNQYFSFVWEKHQIEFGELKSRKEELGIKMMNIQREVDKLNDEVEKESKENQENSKILSLEKARNDVSVKLNALEKDLVVTEGRIEIEKEKEKSLALMEEVRIKSIPVDLNYTQKELTAIYDEQKKLVELIEKAKSLEELDLIKKKALIIGQKLEELQSDLQKGKKEEKEEKKENQVSFDDSNLKSLIEKLADIKKEILECEAKRRKIEEDISKERDEDRKRRQYFFDLDAKLRRKQVELDKAKDEFNEGKVVLARIEVREEDLREDIKKSLGITPEELLEKFGKVKEKVDQFGLENEINKLKIKLDQIGGIDSVVIEEYRETKERYEFLTNEAADLEKAIESLQEVIREMDQKINLSFEDTFVEINKEFTKYFRIIFGGGNAHLTKVKIEARKSKKNVEEETEKEDGDDESEKNSEAEKEIKKEEGIDIFACPPGKKINNLSMLSGGERSLTSLALLFAIISHNPPPFSVLDEVEAALDEANSKRFGRILQELSNQTQFVLITHNRETMRQASLLYGVTMGEDGISKLLSVKLDQVGQGGKILE